MKYHQEGLSPRRRTTSTKAILGAFIFSRAIQTIYAKIVIVSLFVAACSAPPEIVGIDNPATPVESIPNVTQHRVFIATTRQATEVVGALFSGLRSDELGFASVDVSIPPAHEVGKVERPKSLPPDPRTEFAIVDPTIYQTDNSFIAAMNADLGRLPASKRQVLFFIHGYNTTTSEAILTVGQFVEDSGFEGVPVLFTWASAGELSRYVYDMNSALVARRQIIDAAQVVTRTNATGYHIFAHSMGGFLTMEAIRDAARSGEFNRTGRLRNVVLASPDIDIDLFRAQLRDIDTTFDRFFVLLSKDDYALRASRLVAGGVPRVGAADADALSQLGVTAIDLSEIHDSQRDSHSKFAGSPEIVQMIGIGLNATPQYGAGRVPALGQVLGDVPIRVVRGSGG